MLRILATSIIAHKRLSNSLIPLKGLNRLIKDLDPTMSIALVILAAGKGARMQSNLPKVLHEIAGAPMLVHAMMAGQSLAPERCIIIAGHGADAVAGVAINQNSDVEIIIQSEQLGTGHAVDQARASLADFDGNVIVLYGDTPLIKTETLIALNNSLSDSELSVLGFEAKDPGPYGRLITDHDNLQRIVEFKDASDAEKSITLCNSGVMAVAGPLLFKLLSEIDDDTVLLLAKKTDIQSNKIIYVESDLNNPLSNDGENLLVNEKISRLCDKIYFKINGGSLFILNSININNDQKIYLINSENWYNVLKNSYYFWLNLVCQILARCLGFFGYRENNAMILQQEPSM